ncbi:MAG TPA: ATP-binding protein, partial [Ideonella sp.]|nr:ATP-binding protein [Ideonella sp.]
TSAWVHSDPALLEQILRNHVSNALRYTERGGVLVGVRRSGAQGVRLEVWDRGQGIAPEHHGLIFEEFAQLPSPAGRRSKGLGLGLAIVDRAARQLGHARGVRSRLGRGSCFWVELPRAEPAPREETRPAAAPAAPAPWPGEPTIWLVEDEAPLREALAELLARRGARVRAFDGHAALSAHLAEAQNWPDALVCDDHLGDGDGAGCIALVRAGAPLPVAAVLITGSTAPQDLARQAALRVPVLHKPFDGARLVDALAGLLAADRLNVPV